MRWTQEAGAREGTARAGGVAMLVRYWRTVRYLRPVQLYARVAFRAARPRPDLRPAPPRRDAAAGAWARPAVRGESMLGPARFRFLNEDHDLASIGWDADAVSRLWRYNLHYFDDLNARDAARRAPWHASLVERWIADNPPGLGTGWEPYPTSLRIVNWIKWALSGGALSPAAVESLAIQLRWLAQRIERHLLGNHLLSNAKALVFGGLFFEGEEATRWRSLGLGILAAEIDEQILADGAHFELSTMYHALALEDVLDLLNVGRAFPAASAEWLASAIERRVAAMREWLTAMTHPDGEIGFFNDAAIGIAPAPAELEAYAARLQLPTLAARHGEVVSMSPSGYVRLQRGAAVALLDVAAVGPDYLPAHAHADTLSFELSLFGRRVLVNSGTSQYGSARARVIERGTAAHNTVVVDDQDSSEVWGAFRVARRARPAGLGVTESPQPTVHCAHDGYRRLPGRVVHARSWRLGDSSLEIEDRLTGAFTSAEARFHLHPTVEVGSRLDDHRCVTITLELGRGQRARMHIEGGTVRLEPSTWHAQFGASEPTVCVVAAFAGSVLRTRIDWTGPA